MNWDQSQVYVMRQVGRDTLGMWWFEEEGPLHPGRWHHMRVKDNHIWHGDPGVSYGPGGFLSRGDWKLLDNPSLVKWNRLVDCEWIADVKP